MSEHSISLDGVDLSQYVRTAGLTMGAAKPEDMPSVPGPLEVTLWGEWSATLTPQQVMQVLAPEWANVKEGDVVRLKHGDDTIEARVDKIAFDSEGNVFYSFTPLQSVRAER